MTDTCARRRVFLSLGVAAGLALSGCASLDKPVLQTYAETVSALFISQDGKQLVVIGQRHHYVFDAPPQLVAALASALHPQLDGELSGFHVDAAGLTQGDYRLLLPASLSPTQTQQAAALGFIADADGRLQLAGQLRGKRYLQDALRANRIRQTLNRPYTVEVTAEQGRGDRIVDAIASPVTVAAEGVTLLYYAALAPVLIPFSVISKQEKK